MAVEARGGVWVWPGYSLWLGQALGGENDLHAHHAIQVTFALEGRFRLNTDEALVEGEPAAAVAADAPHGFAARGRIAHLWVEPESRVGRGLADALFTQGPLVAAPAAPAQAPLAALCAAVARRDEAALFGAVEALAATLAPPAPPRRDPDRRVRLAVETIGRRCCEPLALDEFATAAGLSPGRFRHLFAAETGLPFKSYVLWRRLMRAVEAWSAGRSLTEAAHEAGFADSAHLSRTFRRMFGQSAATLAPARQGEM